MKNILVTGGSGFIGSNIALELQTRYPEASITVLEDFRSSCFKNLLGFKGDLLAYDCADKSWMSWAKGRKLDIIYHMASITDTTLLDEQKMMYDNVEGFRNILDLAAEKKAAVVYASSAATYGSIDRPIKESDAGNPNNIYGYSKWIMDQLGRTYYNKIKVVGLRFFNVFGPREYYKGHAASMIYQLALQMQTGKRPRIFKWGEQKRDHIYVKDVVEATLMAHKSKESTVMNLGTGQATSFNEIVDALNEALGTHHKPDYFDNPYPFYQNFTQADMSHHEKMTGFRCRFTTREGILDYVRNDLLKK
ncbi:MAG TPA: ADP-glyceromanno-heptose 6-epimerase [Candidatus Omnitrophota bacterium]|nr:ADP-glyceromanno-heptose 6-epimerase [Candidatus Omnitrophota bacterium]HRY85820.1 ADP-glyceromanno-heptose 6-epimerase [Candidatus Omnitrophota bacterium]